MSRPFRRWIVRGSKTLGILVLSGALWLAWFLYWAPLPAELQHPGPPQTAIYMDVHGRIIAELASPAARSHRPIPLQSMGPWLPTVTVSLEDQRFHQHPGIDLRATLRALWTRHGGGSTLSQQLVKLAMHNRKRSLWNKAWESLLSLQLERRWSKEQILTDYLNRISYGNRLIGIEAAAQGYFGKSATALSRTEAIYLAGLPQAPSRLNPWKNPDAANRQFCRSIKRLVSHDIISTDEAATLTLPSIERHLPRCAAPHFIQMVARSSHRGIYPCTLDLDLQRRAEQIVREHLDTLHRADISQSAMVIMDNESAAVRALVGSRSFEKCQINGALAFRNSGSTLKPFLYATGIDRRILTAATLLPDTADAARDAYGDYDPHNFVLNHLGPVRVREALGNSLNVPAVVAVDRIGARKAFDAIAEWGIQFDRPLEKAGAGFILGNVGVQLVDLTGAFSALARGGLACPPRLLETDPKPLRRVVSSDAASIVTDILCDNSARLHSFGTHSILNFSSRVAAKTGTSANFRDAWTMGFTAEHTVGVWVGNFDGTPMNHAASVAAAGPLWRRMMDDLLQSDHPLPTPRFQSTPICAFTGLRPSAASPGTASEYFLPGTEPTASSAECFGSDGHPMLPAEYAGWCESTDNRIGATVHPDQNQLAILAPRDGAVFVLDDTLPAAQQQLEVRVNESGGVAWTINGQPLTPQPDGRVLWPLREGEWALEASFHQQRARLQFVVRRE